MKIVSIGNFASFRWSLHLHW